MHCRGILLASCRHLKAIHLQRKNFIPLSAERERKTAAAREGGKGGAPQQSAEIFFQRKMPKTRVF
eukprot:1161853-Amorphochlora_amoeboformis.AAC.2